MATNIDPYLGTGSIRFGMMRDEVIPELWGKLIRGDIASIQSEPWKAGSQ